MHEDQQQVDERQTIKSRFIKLDNQRSSLLSRARECSKLTIPSLLPPDGSDQNKTLETPYQGLGARGVNNLASKLLLTLLPPNQPFFRMMVDDFTLEQMTGEQGLRAEVEKALNKIERAVQTEVETSALRVPVFEALKHLVVTGNVLVYLPDEGGMKTHRIDHYVVRRDPMGNAIEILIKESIHPVALPLEIRGKVLSQVDTPDKSVDVYTRIVRNDEDKWEVSQEVLDEIIPGTEGTYALDDTPWLPLRWTSVADEDYGRGLIEEYLGDLLTLEALTKAIVEGSAVAARVLFLVDPNGTTRPAKIVSAPNGSVVEGREEDISVLQLDKFADFRVAMETVQRIEQRLAYAFLLMQGVQRDAERVTAEEIRRLAKELEDSLGGVYSVLSQEFQLPLVRRLIRQMTKKKRLPKLPKDIVQPSIVTGMEALGRGNDLEKLALFLQQLESVSELVIPYLNPADLLQRIATALGIDSAGLIKSEEEVQAMQQHQQMAQMAQGTVPGVAQEMMKGMMNGGPGQAIPGQAPGSVPG